MTTDELFERADDLCLLAAKDPQYLPAYEAVMTEVSKHEHQGWKRRTGMTQNERIIKHLRKAGSITVREAIVEYSIQSLTKRIQELREAGYEIISTVKRHPVTGQQYTRYSLA